MPLHFQRSSAPNSLYSPDVLGRRLMQGWRWLTAFMIQPEPDTSLPASGRYRERITLYPYLAPLEEQRDWLERIYQQRP